MLKKGVLTEFSNFNIFQFKREITMAFDRLDYIFFVCFFYMQGLCSQVLQTDIALYLLPSSELLMEICKILLRPAGGEPIPMDFCKTSGTLEGVVRGICHVMEHLAF